MTEISILHTSAGLNLPVANPVGNPRCTIYALHGGGLSSGYWDCPTDETLSLARLAASVGMRVVFPDRPGHRTNKSLWPDGLACADEAALHVAAISQCWPDQPIFLMAQSAGSMVALRAAGSGNLPGLIGIEHSGLGVNINVERVAIERTLETFWGPLRLYPPEIFARAHRVSTPTTRHDAESAGTWSQHYHEVLERVDVPVRITMVDHEAWWGDIPTALQTLSAALTNSPVVETNVEYSAGHNPSVGFAARAYHLGVLAFVERCLRRVGAVPHSANAAAILT